MRWFFGVSSYINISAIISRDLALDYFKLANKVPIFKKGCNVSLINYRPVSLTSVLCKVIKRILNGAVMHHLVNEELLTPYQHGLLPKKSCTTNLLESYATLRELPIGIINFRSVNSFKNAYDKTKTLCYHQ